MQRRPFVLINIAATADGKLAPANRHYVPFTSPRDQKQLLELRATADAVMCGSRTVDLYPVTMGPGPARYRRLRLKRGLAEYNLRVIVSGSGTINPRAAIFKRRFSPILILTTGKIPKTRLRRLQSLADEVKIFGDAELDLEKAVCWLREKWRVKRLLCEGGGELNAALFQAGLADELHLTISPVIFGGRAAPTIADGAGIAHLQDATRLRRMSFKEIDGEVSAVYCVERFGK